MVIEYLQRIATIAAGFAEVDNAPRFNDMVQDLQWGTFHVSRNWIPLPPYYSLLAFPAPPAAIGRRAGGGSDATVTTSGSSGASSGVSALTTPSAVTPTSGERQSRVVNPSQDPEFMALELKPRLGELLRLHRPPTNVEGGEFCVSWWVKGACYSQCSRRTTHKAFASPAERTRLLTHVKTHLVVGA